MTQIPNRLHKHMAAMVALEAAIEQALEQCIPEVADHAAVSAMLREFHAMVKGQLYALDARLQTLVHNMPIPKRTAMVFPDSGRSDRGGRPPAFTAKDRATVVKQLDAGVSIAQIARI